MTKYERTETSTVGSAGENQLISDFRVLMCVVVVITGIVGLLSSTSHCIIIFSALIIIGLVLIHDPQFMKKAIITVPAIVTFSLMLPPNLNPIMGTAIIVMIVGLIYS